MRRILWVFLASFAVLVQGCRGCQEQPSALPWLADAAKAPELEEKSVPVPDRYLKDALWARAIETGDEMDLASLADRYGAYGLLKALEIGGKLGLTALAALPYAVDATDALDRLAQLVVMTSGQVQHQLLVATYRIVSTAQPRGEGVDPDAVKHCAKALLTVATSDNVSEASRAIAVSSLRTPIMQGQVDIAQIPTAFDPKPAAAPSLPAPASPSSL